MGFEAGQMFVNLPVKDLKKSMDFFSKVGFEFNPRFTDENAACMIVGENMYVMLLVENYFDTFIKKEIADTEQNTETILAIATANREQVNETVSRALEAGAKPFNEPFDHGFMYGWSFEDLDGHLWEVFFMERDEDVDMNLQ